MTEDQLIAIAIGFLFLLLAGARAVLRAVRRRRERAREDAQFALSHAELNGVLVERAAKEAIGEGLVKLLNALGEPPQDTRGEDR
ncbi:hypothetical protein GCM10010400_58120 [Streptomyces aculeolatus]|uniref:hypothetical protein n=1 Tax=Streptomyces aculeolatus TaxID=270689 RepID=UPI001CED2214|nr:hypothetical protein [Streptomyces aculeolatus]